MGAPFRFFLESPRVYTCSCCAAHLASDDDVVSANFHGNAGRAFLVKSAVNVVHSSPKERALLSGMHLVADLRCRICEQLLGWKYVRAQQDSQKYKEGHVLLEKLRLSKSSKWL